MFRSDDDGGSFRRIGAIQDNPIDRDTADLVVVGSDIALVYSYEGPELTGSTAHDVWFQWWRQRSGSWSPDPAVRVFDSTSGANGYYRAELAIDSVGRIWVQSFFLENDGSSTGAIALSSDGGAHFSTQAPLVKLPFRGGGRLSSLGSKLLFVYDGHDDGSHAAHFRIRNDSAPVGSWGAEQLAFSEGIYHGAALSAVTDGHGGMHLAYKDKDQLLWYRFFDGAGFGARQLIEDVGEWELQPAITRVGDDLAIFYNRVIASGFDDEVRVRTLHAGQLSAPTVLDSSLGVQGLPGVGRRAADDGDECALLLRRHVRRQQRRPGDAVHDWMDRDDAAAERPGDAAAERSGDDAAPSDLAQPTGGVLFSDNFNRQIAPDNGLGANWSIGAGLWYSDGRAISDQDGSDLAGEKVAACRDCAVQASVVTFGTDGGVYLRAPSPTLGRPLRPGAAVQRTRADPARARRGGDRARRRRQRGHRLRIADAAGADGQRRRSGDAGRARRRCDQAHRQRRQQRRARRRRLRRPVDRARGRAVR